MSWDTASWLGALAYGTFLVAMIAMMNWTNRR